MTTQNLNPLTTTLSSWQRELTGIYFLCRRCRAWLWKAEQLFSLTEPELNYLETLDDLFIPTETASMKEFTPSQAKRFAGPYSDKLSDGWQAVFKTEIHQDELHMRLRKADEILSWLAQFTDADFRNRGLQSISDWLGFSVESLDAELQKKFTPPNFTDGE